MRSSKIIRAVTVICVISLFLNGFLIVRNIAQRPVNMPILQGMNQMPFYLYLALSSYALEFNKNKRKNDYPQPGHPFVGMAFSAYQAAQPLYDMYGFKDTGDVYLFLFHLYFASDRTAYHKLLGLKVFLSSPTLTEPEIQQLFSAIAKEYNQSH